MEHNAGHSSSDLSQRSLRALGWRYVALIGQVLAQLGVIAVLSRLLPPSDFGLVGIALVVIGLGKMISLLGIGPALVQRPDLNRDHIRAGWLLSLLMGIGMGAVVWFTASFWARVFDNPDVADLLRWLVPVVVVSALGAVSDALLRRNLDFRAIAIIQILSYVLGYGAVAITLAQLGFGVRALVWGAIAQSVLMTCLQLAMAPHSIVPLAGWRETREIMRYGVGMSLIQTANYLAMNGDYAIVSRQLGDAALGVYTRAFQLMILPITQIAGVVQAVAFPAMSLIQDETERLGRAYLRASTLLAVIIAPVSICIILMAPFIVRTLLGPGWDETILPLRILATGMVFRAAYKVSDAVVRACGVVYRTTWRVGLFAVAVFAGAIVGSRWGLGGVSVGVTAAAILRFLLVGHLSNHELELSWRTLIGRLKPALLVGVTFLVPLAPAAFLLDNRVAPWLGLATLCGLAAVLLVAMGLFFPRRWFGEDVAWLSAQLEQQVPAKYVRIRRFLNPLRG